MTSMQSIKTQQTNADSLQQKTMNDLAKSSSGLEEVANGHISFIRLMHNEACDVRMRMFPELIQRCLSDLEYDLVDADLTNHASQHVYIKLRRDHDLCVKSIKVAVMKAIRNTLVLNPKALSTAVAEPFSVTDPIEPPYEHVMRGFRPRGKYDRRVHRAAGIFETPLEQVSREFSIILTDTNYFNDDSRLYCIVASW